MNMAMRYACLSQANKKKTGNLLNGLTAPAEKPADPACHKFVTYSKLIG